MKPDQCPLDTTFIEQLKAGARLRGIFNPIPSPAIVEMCAYAGFDFVIIDNEHGCSDFATTENMLRAARACHVPAIVRCLEQDIARTLDLGPSGIMIPTIRNARHAADVARRVRYPDPVTAGNVERGARGCAFSTRAAGYGAFGGPGHIQRSNEGLALILQIETSEAVADAAAIMTTPGVSAVFVGTNDLSFEIATGNPEDSERLQTIVKDILRQAAEAHVPAGLPAFSQTEEDRYAQWGARLFATSATGLITKALQDAAKKN